MDIKIPPLPSLINDELDSIVNKRHGGFFWLEGKHDEWIIDLFNKITSRFSQHAKYARRKLYTQKIRKISFGFTSDSHFNAFAYASNNDEAIPFDFVGINVGVIFTLLYTFGSLLSHPEVFSDIGNPKNEHAGRCRVRSLTTDIFKSEPSGMPTFKPLDKDRTEYSMILFESALDFLFFHELCHLRNGHLEWFRENCGMPTLQEAFSEKLSPGNALFLQALEMDADSGGLQFALNHAYKLKNESSYSFAFGDAKSTVRTIVVAVYSIFRIFDLNEWDVFRQCEFSHPQAPLRQFWIIVTIYEIICNNSAYKYDNNAYVEDIVKVVAEIERSFGYIQDTEPDPRGVFSVSKSDFAREHLEKIKTAWREIRPMLEIYKRGGRLAE